MMACDRRNWDSQNPDLGTPVLPVLQKYYPHIK